MEQPICRPCRMTKERVRGTDNVYACPICGEETIVGQHKSKIDVTPKCGYCGRKCVMQGDYFVCPSCRTVWDEHDDRCHALSHDPVKAAMKAEANRAQHRGKYRPKNVS